MIGKRIPLILDYLPLPVQISSVFDGIFSQYGSSPHTYHPLVKIAPWENQYYDKLYPIQVYLASGLWNDD